MNAIILATASPARLALAAAAGLVCQGDAAHIDEAAIKDALAAEGASALETAITLAEMKAVHVSRRHRGQMVFGADQMLECDGRWFDKPVDPAAAADQLKDLRGKTHHLISAVVAVRDGQRLWHDSDTAALTMRRFSDDFLESYLQAEGDSILGSVGAYRLEARGAQLFSRIEGDYFTILGLPLLPMLDFLRSNKVLPS